MADTPCGVENDITLGTFNRGLDDYDVVLTKVNESPGNCSTGASEHEHQYAVEVDGDLIQPNAWKLFGITIPPDPGMLRPTETQVLVGPTKFRVSTAPDPILHPGPTGSILVFKTVKGVYRETFSVKNTLCGWPMYMNWILHYWDGEEWVYIDSGTDGVINNPC